MNKYNDLMLRISAEYSIVKGKTEEKDNWKSRIIYSVLGRMALSSLLDKGEEDNASIVHMKKRIKVLEMHYRDMYPELIRRWPVDPEAISDEIYDIFLHTGMIYHEPNRILVAAKSEATVAGIRFTRGGDLETRQKVCGLGTYMMDSSGTDKGSLLDMFQMETMPLLQLWDTYVNRARWSTFKEVPGTEYLRMIPPFSRGYWVDKPERNGNVSLLRTGFKGAQLYYLYKMEEGRILASQLPQWLVEGYHYRLLANACLRSNCVLPPSVYKYDGDLVYLRFEYLPPPEEHYFWKLYTWPLSVSSVPGNFNRICLRQVFFAIRSVMQKQGYEFKEE